MGFVQARERADSRERERRDMAKLAWVAAAAVGPRPSSGSADTVSRPARTINVSLVTDKVLRSLNSE